MEAIKEFGSDKVIRIKGVNSHIDQEKNLGNDCYRIEKPIMDFHFLKNCDKAAISKSGFGMLGLWNRKEPYKDVFSLGSSKWCLKSDEQSYFQKICNVFGTF